MKLGIFICNVFTVILFVVIVKVPLAPEWSAIAAGAFCAAIAAPFVAVWLVRKAEGTQ